MFRRSLLLSPGAVFRVLARKPAGAASAVTVTSRPTSFAQSLRVMSTDVTSPDVSADGLKWPKLYPKKVTIPSYFNYAASRRGKLDPSLSVVEEAKQFGDDWKKMSAEEKEKFPSTTQTKQAPKSKGEIYPKEKIISSYIVYCQAWLKLSDEEKAKYPAVTQTINEPEEGADFEHFFRLHKKNFMKRNSIDDTKEAEKKLEEFWGTLTEGEKKAYAV